MGILLSALLEQGITNQPVLVRGPKTFIGYAARINGHCIGFSSAMPYEAGKYLENYIITDLNANENYIVTYLSHNYKDFIYIDSELKKIIGEDGKALMIEYTYYPFPDMHGITCVGIFAFLELFPPSFVISSYMPNIQDNSQKVRLSQEETLNWIFNYYLHEE